MCYIWGCTKVQNLSSILNICMLLSVSLGCLFLFVINFIYLFIYLSLMQLKWLHRWFDVNQSFVSSHVVLIHQYQSTDCQLCILLLFLCYIQRLLIHIEASHELPITVLWLLVHVVEPVRVLFFFFLFFLWHWFLLPLYPEIIFSKTKFRLQ